MRRPALISSFSSMKRLGVFLLPLDGMRHTLVHQDGERHCDLQKNTRQRPQPGLEPEPLADEGTNCEASVSPYYLGCLCELPCSVNSP